MAAPSFNFVTRARLTADALLVEARVAEGFSNVPKVLDDAVSYRNRACVVMAGIRFK